MRSKISRFFVPPQHIRGSAIIIEDPRQLHHIRDVLRLGSGDRVVCFDGQGRECTGTIIQSRSRRLIVHVDQRLHAPPASLTLWLAQGLPKGERFEWVVQKTTELGVTRLSPLFTRHTVVRLSSGQVEKKHERWQRIATEAAKQCGRAVLPVIDPPQTLEALLPLVERVSLILMPTLAVTASPLSEVLRASSSAKDVAVLIGPEGDFSREEVALAERYGARPVCLGPLTLRAETAAIATAAILQHVLGSS